MKLPLRLQVESDHGPGVVGVISQDLTRFREFVASLYNTIVPMASVASWEAGYDVCVNRNNIVQQALNVPHMEWVWFIDDDHIWDGDLLMRLLDRKRDVIHPLVAMRYPPFKAVSCVPKGNGWGEGSLWRPWREIPLKGLSINYVIGAAGLLVRRPVLEKVGFPWFNPGQFDPGCLQEDTFFCKRVYECGFDIQQDNENHIGHIGVCSIWPGQPDGINIRFDMARTNIHVNLEKQEKWIPSTTSPRPGMPQEEGGHGKTE